MTLSVHPFGAYLTTVAGRTREAVQMSAVVHILKKDMPRAPASDTVDLDGQAVSLKAGARADVLRLFGKWGARRLSQIGTREAVLVGVPGSSHVAAGPNFTAGRMAAAVAQYGPYRTNPMLYFTQAMKPAHGGNRQARDIDYLTGLLACTEQRVSGTIILVDDVVTTGAHMVACARFLRARGATVTHALCAARSVGAAAADPFNIPSFDIAT